MRIASVSTDYPGPRNLGRGLFIQRRLRALGRLADVRVIHLEPWFPWLRPFASVPSSVGYPEEPPVEHRPMFYLPGVLKGLDSFWVKRTVVPAVRQLERTMPVDVLDAHFGYPEGVGCALAGAELGKPFFITLRGLETQVMQDPWKGPQLRRALQKSAGIVCVSDSLRKLSLRHGIPDLKIRVIPNAVDRTLFRKGDRRQAREWLGLRQDVPLVVAVGQLVYAKGHHLLVQAMSQLKIEVPDLQLVIIGGQAHEPSYPCRLRTMIADFRLEQSITLAGSQSPERLVRWLRAADIFALPTYDEGCCNAILEAMSCGLPVVTTPAGDNATMVESSVRGLLVPFDNVEALAAGVKAALSKHWDRDRIASYGADYTWGEVAQQTLAFYEQRLEDVRRKRMPMAAH